jgi:hypothetical protein
MGESTGNFDFQSKSCKVPLQDFIFTSDKKIPKIDYQKKVVSEGFLNSIRWTWRV